MLLVLLGFYAINADTSKKPQYEAGGVSWQNERSTAKFSKFMWLNPVCLSSWLKPAHVCKRTRVGTFASACICATVASNARATDDWRSVKISESD